MDTNGGKFKTIYPSSTGIYKLSAGIYDCTWTTTLYYHDWN